MHFRSTMFFVMMMLCLTGAICTVEADEPIDPLNLKLPTLGGVQFWADELHFHQWRIQRNIFTGHCRLLDAGNVRHAWGSFEQCKAHLDKIKRNRKLPPMKGKAVILLHGLVGFRSTMEDVGKYLQEKGGYVVLNVSYPSTQASVHDHAKRLHKVIKNLDGISEINFVAHSLGNLVVRHYLADQTDEKTGRRPDRRIHRIVMFAPPNQGSEAAQKIGDLLLFKLIAGRPGQQFARGWDQLEKHMIIPQCEFGIIAGDISKKRHINPLVTGKNDLFISVETTKLAGARDFKVLPLVHPFMMKKPIVQQYTLNFLRNGYFVSEEKRQPIKKNN